MEAFKVLMLILWENCNQLMILAVVITNANKTGRTGVLGKTAYYVNKYSQIFYWSIEFKYKMNSKWFKNK
jgi:hypothetical protein